MLTSGTLLAAFDELGKPLTASLEDLKKAVGTDNLQAALAAFETQANARIDAAQEALQALIGTARDETATAVSEIRKVAGFMSDEIARAQTAEGTLLPSAVLNTALTLQPDGTLIVTIGGTPTVLGKVTLPDLGAASDAARRQLETDVAILSAAVAQLATGQSIVQSVFRDAGLYTDPASGVAKLYAIESRADQVAKLSVTLNAALGTIGLKADVNYVNQQILAAQLGGQTADLTSLLVRLTSAETNISGLQATVLLKADATVVTGLQGTVTAVQQSIDAINATLSQKASQTQVDAQGARLTLAEQTLSSMDGATIAQAVTASRRAPADADAAGATTIMDLLTGAAAAQAAQTGIAQARQELGARVDGVNSAIASLTLSLGVQIGAVAAQVATESAARISSDAATAGTLSAYQASNDQAVAQVTGAVTAQVTATSQLSASITALNTTVGGHSTTLTSYGASIGALAAKWGVEFNTDGVVTGFVLNDNSGRTDITFVVDNFRICQPDGSASRTVFEIAGDGTVLMPSVQVDTLAVNTAVSPLVSTSTTATNGTSTATGSTAINGFVNLFQKTLTIPAPGLIRIECSLAQAFTGGVTDRPWQLYLSVNGGQLPESVVSGTVPGDDIQSVGYYYAAAAGSYTIRAVWGAHTSIVAKGRSLCALGLAATMIPPDTTDGGNYTPTGSTGNGSGSGGTGSSGGGGGGGGGFVFQQP